MKSNNMPELTELGFRSHIASEEWKNELVEDIRHGYC